MKKPIKIAAIIYAVVLIGLYFASFIFAIIDNPASMTMFKGCIACTLFVPIISYAYAALHKYAMMRSKRADYYSDSEKADVSETDKSDADE